jgi:hypothetical protein
MIEYLAILRQNGELLYSKNILNIAIEEEVLMGFFASVSNFSQEALQLYVDEISLGEFKKIILVNSPHDKVIIGAIVDRVDSKTAVRRIINELLLKFISNYGPQFSLEQIKSHEVDGMLNGLFGKYVKVHNMRHRIKTWFVFGFLGILVRAISFLIGIRVLGLFNISQQNIDPSSFALLGTLNVLLLYGFPVFLDGYMAGTQKRAIRNSIIYLLLIQFSYQGDAILGPILIGFLPVSIILTFLFSFAGVYYASQKYLFKEKK